MSNIPTDNIKTVSTLALAVWLVTFGTVGGCLTFTVPNVKDQSMVNCLC